MESIFNMVIAFITDGNNGLGYETAKWLIRLGCKGHIGLRDENRGKLQQVNLE